MPIPLLDRELTGFKASHYDHGEMFISYFYFTDDQLAAYTIGTTMGMDSLNSLAEETFGPYAECFDVLDSGLTGVTCLGVHEDSGVAWTSTEVHSTLSFFDLEKFGSEFPSSETPEPPARMSVHDGFQIVSFDFRWEGDTLWAVGEVRNIGDRAAGVELQVIARDTAGQLVDVATFWPASINNIRPGMSYGFRHPVTRQRAAAGIEVQIVGSQVW